VIISKGIFTIPLYHGTSQLFLPSIMEKGLGANNPLYDFEAYDLMQRLFIKADSVLAADKEWHATRFMYEWFNKQVVTDGNANFQHGQTYLTPSRGSAINYAISNPLGSEFLSHCKTLWAMIEKVERGSFDLSDSMRAIFSSQYKPVLLQICDVSLGHLLSEDGKSPDINIDGISQVQEFLADEKSAFNFNFRLKRLIEPERIKYQYLKYEIYCHHNLAER
jgi:hypothetical protein